MCTSCCTGAFSDGRLVVAITKFDANYRGCGSSSESEEESDFGANTEYHNLSSYRKIEEKSKTKLCDTIQDATRLAITPDIILPICGEWALRSSKLRNCIEANQDSRSKKYRTRFKHAAEALHSHPGRSELGIPGAQGQSELETILRLEPHKIVEYLDQVTGIHTLRKRYHIIRD